MPVLEGRIAVVTGASRGAGRGIAHALAEAGATVYLTGRRTRTNTTSAVGGTLDDAAASINRAGGRAYAVCCDHAVDAEVEALFARVKAEAGRLDLLVNNAWGGNGLGFSVAPFWELSFAQWDANLTVGVRSSIVASALARPLLEASGRGLIVNTSYEDRGRFTTQLYYDLAMNAVNRLAFGMALDLRPLGVAVVALSPGFMRTEHVLHHFGVDESSWRRVEALQGSESTAYIGRAVAALAADPEVMARSGQVLWVGALAREYGFTDADGSQPEVFRASMGTRGT
jgi:NAD(P)-dependent dehydrogenase (short-subunit alcohol dehydrogenase family)